MFGTDLNIDFNALLDQYIIPWGIKLALALAILLIGLWVVRVVVKVARRVMNRAGADPMLSSFLGSILKGLLLIAVIIAALDQVGVQTTSLIAVLGAAGLAVGLALQGSLSNFAAGIMLIVFKPFKVGDFIEAAGTAGIVEEIRIFNSMVRSPDNREIIIPNGQIYNGVIVNVTARPQRRIDLVVGISYDDDIRKAREIVETILRNDERVLQDPEPTVGVMDLADSSINLYVRPWVNSADFWVTRGDLLERIKTEFDAAGITIPFPQSEITVRQTG
ncbi:MAG: mechanosensitive ion channel [Gammaproteobacteria bacterium]|nr:mechanosensitive ion channel [Gammaproteobacteria bacterium]MDX5374715.1 mechanosensitive ion channel [Gammaproteobacteria bacterium]